MNILQVCPKYYPSIGGVEEHVRNVCERLARSHSVTVFTTDPSGRLPQQETINGVAVRRFKGFSPSDSYHLSLEMSRELKSAEFDIVHGHSYHALPLYFARHAKRKRFVVTTYYHGHGSTSFRDFLIRLYKPMGRKALEEADRVIALSNHEKRLLLQDFRIEPDRVIVIPSGIDLSEFENLNKEKGSEKTILYVGRLEEYKGVQHIIRALPGLDSAVKLEIVGKGPFKPHLESLAENLGLWDRVHFYQDLSRKELLDMYASASVFVLLSQYESYSIAVAEALAAGTPCIVADTSALSEWIDNRNCFGIDYPVDRDQLARLVNRAIGTRAGDVKLFDWDEVATETARVYQL